MSDFKELYLMNLPSQDEEGRKLWRAEVVKLSSIWKKSLNICESTEDKLRDAARLKNRERCTEKISEVMIRHLLQEKIFNVYSAL